MDLPGAGIVERARLDTRIRMVDMVALLERF